MKLMSAKKFAEYDFSEANQIYPVIFEMLENIQNKSIADYGCGEGILLEQLIKQGANVYGYDISPEMIRKSRSRLKDSAVLDVIESGKIPLKDNSLDAIVSNLVFMMCPTKNTLNQIFHESKRVLKKNGILVYTITHPAFNDRVFTTYRNIFKNPRDYFNEEESYQFVLKKSNGTEITDPSFKDHHYTLSTYLNSCINAGLSLLQIKEIQMKNNSVSPYVVIKCIKI